MAKTTSSLSTLSQEVDLDKGQINQRSKKKFNWVFGSFAHDARAIAYIAPILDQVVNKLAREANDELESLFAKIGNAGEKTVGTEIGQFAEKKTVEIQVDMESLQKVDFFHKIQKANPNLRSSRIIGKSLVLTLVSQFDISSLPC